MRLTLAASAVAPFFHVAGSASRSFAGRRRRRRDGGSRARRGSGRLVNELLLEAVGPGGGRRLVARDGDGDHDHGEEEEERQKDNFRGTGVREASLYDSVRSRVEVSTDRAEPAAAESERLRKRDVDGINGTDAEKECDPDSYDPDVGILSCGFGRQCVEDEASTLGGFCSPGSEDDYVLFRQARRRLQRGPSPGGLVPGCNPRDDVLCLHDTVPRGGDCTYTNTTNGGETLSCENYCFDEAQTICANSLEGLFENQNGTTGVSLCADFDRESGAPYARACFRYSANAENNGDISYQCTISVNNRACACSPSVCPVDIGGFSYEIPGFQFDCTVLNFCAKGNTCNGNRAPLFSLLSPLYAGTPQFIDCGTPKEDMQAPKEQPTAALKKGSLIAPSAAQVLACPMVQIQIVTLVLGLLFQAWE